KMIVTATIPEKIIASCIHGDFVMKRWLIPLVMLMMHSESTRPGAFDDEGMWLFNNPPRKLLKEKYDFDATEKWLEHVQKSSVRFNSGGGGGVVSPDCCVCTT